MYMKIVPAMSIKELLWELSELMVYFPPIQKKMIDVKINYVVVWILAFYKHADF